MSSIFQNILWCVVGIAGIFFIIKIAKKTPTTKSSTHQTRNDNTNNIDNKTLTPTQSAKDAFISNVDKFSTILPQLNGSLDIESWTEQIVDINNPQLTALWKRCLKNIAVWKQMLSSWGLRQDTCKNFTFLEKYTNMYDTSDNSTPTVGCKYRVIDGCWILTDDNSGNKHVVKKGIIEKL